MKIPTEGPVVVGVGRTPADAAAVRLAAREAASRGRLLQVVHAFTWHGDTGYAGARRLASGAVQEAVATAQRCTPGVTARGQIVDGPAGRVLTRLSRYAVLVVVGGPLTEVAARAWCPVAVTRAHRTPSGPVLAALDDSPWSAPTWQFAAEAAARRGGPVHVVHVTGPGGEAEGERILDRLLAGFTAPVAVHRRILTGDPAAALVHASRRAGLMVLGPRATAPAGRLGTVAEQVLRRGTCPVVLVHGAPNPARRVPAPGPTGSFQEAR